MINRKAIEVLKTFSDNECWEFQLFITNEFFNKRNKLVDFYETLLKFYPEFNSDELTNEYLFADLFPNKKFNDALIRNYFSDLFESLMEFLIIKNLRSRKTEAKKFLIQELSSRKLKNVLERELENIEAVLSEYENIDGNYLLQRFQLETDRFNHNIVNKKLFTKASVKEDVELLLKRGDYLICFFVMELLKEADILNKYTRIFNMKLESNMLQQFLNEIDLDSIVKIIKEYKLDISYIFEAYFLMWKSFQQMDDEYFKKWKSAADANVGKMSIEEKHFLYGKMIEYMILKNKEYEKDNKYDLELLKLYELFLSKGYYKTGRNDYLMVDLFRNILINGIRLGMLDWTEEFVEKYVQFLHPDNKKNLRYYCDGVLDFERGDFRSSLDNFLKVKLDLFVFKFDLRNYMIRIYYELGLYEIVFQQIDSYKHFLNSQEMVSEERKKTGSNFVKYVNRIATAKTKNKKTDTGFLIKEIDKDVKDKLLKKWLIQKAEELIKNQVKGQAAN